MANKAKADEVHPIYQLKIALRHTKPPIWRRVQVPGGFSLFNLHRVIQIAMGWSDSHLHQFIIDGSYYSIPSKEDWELVIDERCHSLAEVAPVEKKAFHYVYDFGDNWEHLITVEKILPPVAGVKYALCLTAKRACPPEDIGGVWGYANALESLAGEADEERDLDADWLGAGFDPTAVNLNGINAALRRLK